MNGIRIVVSYIFREMLDLTISWIWTRFLQGGADIIETNTYQANVHNLVQHLNLNTDDAVRLLQRGVHLAQQAREEFLESDLAKGFYVTAFMHLFYNSFIF